jgi:hypothetical protein
MPLIPIPDWPAVYAEFVDELLSRIRLDRMTLGGICSYQTAWFLMNAKLSDDNVINHHLAGKSSDGRMRYSKSLRVEMYGYLCERIRSRRPDLTIALCLEEHDVWRSVGLIGNLGKCNCVL